MQIGHLCAQRNYLTLLRAMLTPSARTHTSICIYRTRAKATSDARQTRTCRCRARCSLTAKAAASPKARSVCANEKCAIASKRLLMDSISRLARLRSLARQLLFSRNQSHRCAHTLRKCFLIKICSPASERVAFSTATAAASSCCLSSVNTRRALGMFSGARVSPDWHVNVACRARRKSHTTRCAHKIYAA